MRPKRVEAIKWSSCLTYAVGLLAADGGLSVDGRHIDFTSKDVQLLKTFKKCLGLKNKIGFKSSGFLKKKYPHVQFGDIILYKWLLKIGLTPRKSKTIGELKIPDKYFFDFLRGFFDGDGSCYSYWDSRWASSFMFYISFTSGSLCCLKWIRSKLKKLLKINGHIKSGTRSWQLNYAKKESRVLISKIYNGKNIPHLKRKYEKLKRILDIDNKENNRTLNLNERVLELVDSLD